jgi:hypothetical protein
VEELFIYMISFTKKFSNILIGYKEFKKILWKYTLWFKEILKNERPKKLLEKFKLL